MTIFIDISMGSKVNDVTDSGSESPGTAEIGRLGSRQRQGTKETFGSSALDCALYLGQHDTDFHRLLRPLGQRAAKLEVLLIEFFPVAFWQFSGICDFSSKKVTLGHSKRWDKPLEMYLS